MFTCCPNCETIFKVSAKQLQQGAGQVRCGQCDFSFSALSNIQESAGEAAANLRASVDQGENTDAPPDELPEEAANDPEQRVTWKRGSAMESSSLENWGADLDKDFEAIEEEEAGQIDLSPEEEPDSDSGDSDDSMPETVSEDEPAVSGEVVLVEDAEAFEAAVLATIHATESKAWESSGPHLVGGGTTGRESQDDDDDTPPAVTDGERPAPAEQAPGDDDPSDEETGVAEYADDDPNAGEAAEWLSNETQDTDPETDPDQPSMDFLEKLADGADEEASLEDINVDDEDESRALAQDRLSEDEDADESEERAAEALPEDDKAGEPEEPADDELSENEDLDEAAELVDDGHADEEHDEEPEAPPDEKHDEEGSAPQDSGRETDEADVAHADDVSDSGVEEIWLGEITLESAEKDELEFDVPDDQVDSVFMAADEEQSASEAGAEIEGGSEAGSLEEFFDSNAEGAEEIILSTEDVLDFGAAEAEPESAPTSAGAAKKSLLLATRYRRPAAIAGLVALAFLLLAQLTHYFRYQILENGSLGPVLESVYSGLGVPLTRQWDLEAYNIRRTKVVGNETGTGVVEISAILTNRATFAQPYPILRLIFTDQWEEALAIRDLNASEYLQTDPGDQARMATGEQVAIDVRVMDLADNLAQNYRIEYCLRDSDQNLRCK
ncbi:MAG: DUF3426 domain-containing protein [Gammaproteobacteria bacterium]|nr:DUF3426 domain-containing protein [Gammaproteobacteria bacterium]